MHAIIIATIFFIVEKKKEEQKPKEYTANLISPPEVEKPPLEIPKLKPLPPAPSVRKQTRPFARPPKTARRVLPVPLAPLLPGMKLPPPPGAPAPPGEGKGSEKISPDGILPSRPGVGKDTGIGSIQKRGAEKPFAGNGNFLFDREITEAIAKRDGAGGKPGDRNNPVTFDSKPYEFGPYMDLLRKKIESIWVYPPDAAARNIFGDLKIQFTIKKDGRLGELKLIRTSGYKMLDDAALQALKEGEPYWPLPKEWHKESYTILGHFVYSLYGAQLR